MWEAYATVTRRIENFNNFKVGLRHVATEWYHVGSVLFWVSLMHL